MRHEPGMEYFTCKVVGSGWRFIEAYKSNDGNNGWYITPGVIIGTVVLCGRGLGLKTLDSDMAAPREGEPIFDMGKFPSDADIVAVTDRMLETHPIQAERIVCREWAPNELGWMKSKTWLAPRGFVIPTVNTAMAKAVPENTIKKSAWSESKPLEVTLGEILLSTCKSQKKQKQAHAE
ncbi:hypothetical protein UFOVP276_178 [uncultured Caudovirales phage]|uniref:Uncharacterized protein n=1 Tax=uncultured Caudovirales phage TaxID=2100421 RepID=A0A6J5LNI9_9CAUD|nr:hypothetical protein UFOVP127_72 [uncultured Caudovirales phage]CAB4135222.1 hypothetical protein UFOVP276_178 [uncultured Caudovirales phage]